MQRFDCRNSAGSFRLARAVRVWCLKGHGFSSGCSCLRVWVMARWDEFSCAVPRRAALLCHRRACVRRERRPRLLGWQREAAELWRQAELWEEDCPPVPVGALFHFWAHALSSSDTRKCQALPLFIRGGDLGACAAGDSALQASRRVPSPPLTRVQHFPSAELYCNAWASW